jgi:serine/threonine-protein phosphatase 2B regulatory subunit
MGNSYTSQCTLTESELAGFQAASVFSVDEIKALWCYFKKINSQQEFINRKQFQAAMLFKDSALLDRIFRVFDLDDDNQISFPEYLSCLSIISSKATKEDKLKFSFQIYDFDGDSYISTTDLTAVVAATLREHQIVILRAEIDQIVSNTMREANSKRANMIAFDEYVTMIHNKPHMLAQLTINISGIIAEYTKNNVIALSNPRGFASALYIHEKKV